MEINRNITMNQVTWFVVMLLGFFLAVFMGSAVGSADLGIVSIVLGVGIGIATFLILGKNYWLLIPFSLGASFPALPVGGRTLDFPELAIAGSSLFFLLRLASRKEKLQIFRQASVPILLFVAWVSMVFILNPVGLAMLGSEMGGGRFYLKLALSFTAFLIMSNREYTEREMRWIFAILVFSACFSLVYGFAEHAIVGPAVNITTGMVANEFYTWHQLLAGPPLTISFLIFARWSPKEIFTLQRIWLFLSYFVCLALVLLSGKRMAMLAMVVVPLISAIAWRQFIPIFVALILATASLIALTAGHGQLFQLPLVAQRTISFLPGDWDPEMEHMAGGKDEWREELRFWATQMIKAAPWVGSGFALNIQETSMAAAMGERGGTMDIQVASYVLGRSWHNTWLGYAADFGIPLSVIQAIIYIWVIVLSAKVFRQYGNRSLFGVFALYLLLFTVRDLIASHTSGHTALDAWSRWWMYGVLVSLYCALPKKQGAIPAGSVDAKLRNQPMPIPALNLAGRRVSEPAS